MPQQEKERIERLFCTPVCDSRPCSLCRLGGNVEFLEQRLHPSSKHESPCRPLTCTIVVPVRQICTASSKLRDGPELYATLRHPESADPTKDRHPERKT